MRDDSTVLVLQHDSAEHLGRIKRALAAESVRYHCVRPDLGQRVPLSIEAYSGLVVLGGPQSLMDKASDPHLAAEERLVRSVALTDTPVLGVCLGSQLLAGALGATVSSGRRFEVGWEQVTVKPEARIDPLFAELPETLVPLHWHRDVFDLPHGATPLAASASTSVQGFAWQGRCYGLLFHLEMTCEQVDLMCSRFPDDAAQARGGQEQLLEGAANRLAQLKPHADRFFRSWVRLVVARHDVVSGAADRS